MATSEPAQIVNTLAFSYRGFDIPALDVPTRLLIYDLNTGEPACELAPRSAPLAWKVGLYTVGRDLALGISDAEALPEPIRQVGSMIYKECQAKRRRGVFHNDGIIIEPGATIKGSVRPGNDYQAARFFKGIKGFEYKDGVWQIKPSPGTLEERVWVPSGGLGSGSFIVPGKQHPAYDPITGLPVETITDRNEVIERWVEAGLTREEAGKELSRFYRGTGTCAVLSWSEGRNGPLCVDVYGRPDRKSSEIGSSALRRSAERSEAQQE